MSIIQPYLVHVARTIIAITSRAFHRIEKSIQTYFNLTSLGPLAWVCRVPLRVDMQLVRPLEPRSCASTHQQEPRRIRTNGANLKDDSIRRPKDRAGHHQLRRVTGYNLLALISKSARSGGPLRAFELPIVLSSASALAMSELPKVDKYWGWATTDLQENAMELIITKFGYGYSTRPRSIRLAMAVIAAYCLATIPYLAYILISGDPSTACNSAIELVAPALQSRRPDDLGLPLSALTAWVHLAGRLE